MSSAPQVRATEGPRPETSADMPSWHALDPEEALLGLKTRATGLSPEEATVRLAQHGPNALPETARPSLLRRIGRQMNNLFIYALIAAAGLSLLFEHALDAVVIMAVVVINTSIGVIQEGRAERALDSIRAMIDPRAQVLRSGARAEVAAADLVPGDIVLVEAGDRVPADLRLIEAAALRLDEAALTGESVAVDKMPAPVDADSALGDRRSMLFKGCLVVAGGGRGVVVATGARTQLGQVSTLMGGVESLKTPLLRQMDGFARTITLAILGFAVLAFGFAIQVRGFATDEAFMAVVGLAVAAIPEGLPAMMTITLALGVQRMARRNAIIRRLPAVETLGSVSVICSDKTGTLTTNEMSVRRIVTPAGQWDVEGEGYSPEGRVLHSETAAACDESVSALARAAALCNDAELREEDGGWSPAGDPMEAALVAMAGRAGLDTATLRRNEARRAAIPFDAAHRYMATLHAADDGAEALIKGAPEAVMDLCGLSDDAHARWAARAESLAAEGQRVLAFARAALPAGTNDLDHAALAGGAEMLGLAGLIDPPRPEAVGAVADCRRAGIRVIMITGDHAATARAIAGQLGLERSDQALTGRDLAALDTAGLREALRHTDVFARTAPADKLRLVEALQAEGHVVAMTGDGVNDAPALKRADIGVAMGRKGTEAAKEASETVLADDNFASIVAAVREGRTVYDNLMKMITWNLPANGGEAMTILFAIAAGLALPVTPVQILWINMVCTVALGLTLAFEPTEPDAMRRPPRPSGARILSGLLLWRVMFVSALFVIGAFGIYSWAIAAGREVEHARTLVVNTIVVMEIFYLFSVRYVHGTSLTARGALGTPAVLTGVSIVILAQLAFTYAPPMQFLFDTRPVSLAEGAGVIAIGIAVLVVVEIEKRVRRTIGKG